MTTRLVTVEPQTTARAIKDIFEQHEFHHLPVVEGNDKLLGIISKQDFYKVAYVFSLETTGRTWSEKEYEVLKAKDLMTDHPLSLEPEDTIGLAADIFLANQFHAIPVVEDDRLVGLITTHDLLLYSFSSPIPDLPI
jgi:CBS domain-containing protein